MLVILSPSKTLDERSAYPATPVRQPDFLPRSEALAAILRGMDTTGISALMKISPALAALNHQRFAAFHPPFTERNARPALFLFKGDVYDGLDAYSLDASGVAYADDHLRILSGLYGVLRPLDYIQPYRLEMGTPLATPQGKGLYRFWGSALAEALNATGAGTLINLASEEYARAIDRKALTLDEITLHFKERRGDRLQVIGLFAKKARGMMARHILTRRVADVAGLQAFTGGGYRYEPTLSSARELVFIR